MMAGDKKSTLLSKPGSASKFGEMFVEAYMSPAFGARSKSEIDLLVFTCLIEVGAIDPDAPVYDIARAINIPPVRVRNLIFNWQLRSTSHQGDLRAAIVAALKRTRFSGDGKQLTFGVESPLLKEEITARLKRKGVFTDASFSKELVKLPVEAFVEFLDDIVDDETKKQVKTTLVKDKQLPNKSFKALATGVLGKLGEKVAGEVGKELAGDLVAGVGKPAAEKAIGFLTGLLTGDAKGATKGITKEDFPE
jgi:hypothetical protein